MVFVPYEFGAALFQHIYTHVRPLGSLFLVGSATMLVALLYPSWPGVVGWAGRALFVGAVSFYWWSTTVLNNSMTGGILYPLMVAALLLERTSRFQGRGLLAVFTAVVALCFGMLMTLSPQVYLRFSLLPVAPLVRLMGVLFLASGSLLAVGLWRRQPGVCRLALAVLGLLFLNMLLALGARASWAGMGVYSVLALACWVLLLMRQMPSPVGVRWRLFRGMALASVLPILGLGAVTSTLAQRALEAELREKALQAVAAETAWLEQTATMARSLLRAQSRDVAFVATARSGDREALRERVDLLENDSGLFDAAWVLDDTGETLVPSTRLDRRTGNFSAREYFQHALKGGDEVLLSRPFLTSAGLPFVVFTAPVDLGTGRRLILVAGLSLRRLGLHPTLASRSYHVELFDRRDGSLLRETDRGDVLSRAPALELLAPGALSAAEGMAEAFDPKGRRLMVAHAQVAGTPWTVVVTARLREAFAPVTRMGAWVVVIALVAGAIALVLSQWVGRDVAGRLEALRDGFAALGTPALEGGQRVQARGDDEVSQLASGFNEMAARIDRTQKELREAIAIRDQFLSMASHELRTPLTPLKATLDLLIRQSESGQELNPERRRATFSRLNRQVDRLTRLIGDMLDVSRLQSGRFTLTVAPMDLGTLAHEVVERIGSARPERQGLVSLEVPSSPLMGRWDEQRLDQLLTNLVENALRYSPPETPVRVRVVEEPGGVRVDVEDRGIGIPQESLSQLFTPFYRARNAAEHYAGGLGLGLAICREIVERHGGHIQVTSAGPGQGSCFTVRLPRAAVADAAA
ncbi:sensor histidine kinase [Corallococcus sp. ZKHCc1 1396]|uniref:histidine kinase n=1 Tax=Corallococcus soli TaxID=2710757 RepID=A0ABR9PQY1_9BACT|nr:sensor histidine kinase [Corallococcus soli]MBE4750336.1 sensor histidine kinase [Corallococcus soli]